MSSAARSHAVIVGGSIGGLTAAGALSKLFQQVTLIERDPLSASPEPRKGAPQGLHLHGLLLRGQQLMEELFPGLTADLQAGGAVRVEFGRDLVWHHFGGWKASVEEGVPALTMTRTF